MVTQIHAQPQQICQTPAQGAYRPAAREVAVQGESWIQYPYVGSGAQETPVWMVETEFSRPVEVAADEFEALYQWFIS